MNHLRPFRSLIVLFFLVLYPAAAFGQSSEAPLKILPPKAEEHAEVDTLDEATSSPWRAGVTEEDTAQARALFQEGNSLVRESVFVPAIDKYEEALKHWDHPGIHYNLSLALLNLEQPLRLRHHLVEALKYEGRPLGEEQILRAKQYLNLVEKQLSHLVVRCDHHAATVKLDDKLAFRAPGKLDEYLPPGRHRLVTSAPGYVSNEQDLSLVPGETKQLDIKLYTEQEWTKYKRKWSPVGPIVLTVSGIVVAGTGGLLFWLGGEQIKKDDERIQDECPMGCDEDDAQVKHTGQTMQIIGIASMATGGAATLVGGILLYVNRQIPYREDPGKRTVSFTPVVGPQFSGLLASGSFQWGAL
jgi:hypothetical protein